VASAWASLIFLLDIYWPYMAVAAGVGAVTGWINASRKRSGA
jgi:hypothetical protein